MYQNFMPCPDPVYMPFSRMPMPEMGDLMLARAYVPDQPYIGLLPLNEALAKGTVFPNLVVPFPHKR
ncbi:MULTISPECIES: spore coat associated protein CotJA [Clostridium]|uniref:Spore coat associated protein CotJA n=2 Tax=Clostridium TaxID=1485 RepID=A0A151AM19_9CLOT|nr:MULTISPECIES: spore coat associated protein CotJA [Clostridium]KYH28673.1 spore coat associated protein CotJA [Clostridium colicanis DSM 13634]PRR73379.1 Spore coat associated protein JA [Clostridium thermopalmarium DSM 5974]PVZ22135.1 spore coat associated protein JA (CotJA) [Clostridium thermopalmarium DSM 5974]